MAKRSLTTPRLVIMRNGSSFKPGGAQYYQPDGTWGDYRTAKRFKAETEETNAICDAGGHGVFPCSAPRAIWRRKPKATPPPTGYRLRVYNFRTQEEAHAETFQGSKVQASARLGDLWNTHTPPDGRGWKATLHHASGGRVLEYIS